MITLFNITNNMSNEKSYFNLFVDYLYDTYNSMVNYYFYSNENTLNTNSNFPNKPTKNKIIFRKKPVKFRNKNLYNVNPNNIQSYMSQNNITSDTSSHDSKSNGNIKRLNHFEEKLKMFISPETTNTNIPIHVYDTINLHLKKNNIMPINCTPNIIKTILKKHKLFEYYKCEFEIYQNISGNRLEKFTDETYEKLKQMFMSVRNIYDKHTPPTRTCFFSYNYLINKLLKILNLNEHAKCFGMLKSKEKLRDQDVIWSKICEELNWEFHSSL